jgi:PLP dependent protein
MSIKDAIANIKKDIPEDIIIVAATKRQDVGRIQEAIDAGITIIGENYVSEALMKCNIETEMHCLGHLQTNKVKKAVKIFDMIQTVDSEKIVKEISKHCQPIGKSMPVLIEVNIAKEPQKNGCMPRDVVRLAQCIARTPYVVIRGVMTMGPRCDTPEDLRPHFKEAKKIYDMLKHMFPSEEINTLSMGMSSSYKIAIAEGATMVRLGTGIFGKRDD